jgi:hypothetical protein
MLADLQRTLDEAAALAVALTSPQTHAIELHLSQPTVTRLMCCLFLGTAADGIETILISRVPNSREGFLVQPQSQHTLLRKCIVRYDTQSVSPRLTLSLPSMGTDRLLENTRTDWLQQEGSDSTLEIYTFDVMYFGRITTRYTEPTEHLQGNHIRLLLPHLPGMRFLVTTIEDKHHRPLVRLVRIVLSS